MIEYHDEDYHSYTFVTDDNPVAKFEITGAYQDKGAVWGEVSVTYLFDGQEEPVISFKRLNMLTDKRPGIEDLSAKADMWDWDAYYEEVTRKTVAAVRQPPKHNKMNTRDDEGLTAAFLVGPFVLNEGVSLLFGPGGTGKSMIGLGIAISVTSGRTVFGNKPSRMGNVIYLDYEDTLTTHENRMTAILRGMNIEEEEMEYDIHHLKPRQSIARSRRDLLGLIRELQPALVIVDSVGLARGGDAMGSEDTIRLFSTLGALGVPVLGIDHMTKDDVRGGKMLTPYGSIYTVNSVRLAWSVKATDLSDDNNTYLNLVQTKRNTVARHDAMGAHIMFHNELMPFGEDNAITEPVLRKVTMEMSNVWWDADEDSTIDRLLEYMSTNGNASGPEMATALNLKADTVTRTLRRHEGDRVEKKTRTNPVIWGVPE